MAWDAGAISASLTIDTAKASADLDKIEARVKRLTDTPHRIRISAVFDDASTGKALAAFRSLDNAISRDAMQRLRSSPQGSVLGALNALFSPHPVTGAPSAQQAASQGLLGKMFTPQGGGSATPAGKALNNAVASTGPGNTSSQDLIKQVVTGAGPGNVSTQDMIKQVLTGNTPGNVSTEDMIKQVLTGNTPGNVSTQDLIKQVMTGKTPGNVNTEDLIKQVVTGKAPGNIDTTDTVHEKLDEASKAKVITDSADSGDKAGAGFSAMFTSHARSLLTAVNGMFGGGGGGGKIGDSAGKSGGGAGDSFAKGFGAHLIAGIGPVILAIPAKMALLAPAIATAMATLPALAGVIGAGMGVAMIGGLIGGVVATNPKLKAQLKGLAGPAKAAMAQIGAPIVPALSAAFAQIPALLKSVTPQLTAVMKEVAPQIAGVFAARLTPIIKGLVSIMQAAAPAFGPVLEGLEKLVANILPGIQIVIKAMVPFLSQFAGILATLGSHLGQFFAAAAPAIGASMKVLGTLLDLIGALLPVIMKLAGAFATGLAPVITQLAVAIKALTPFFTILGSLFASLASAILGDLVSAFTAIAKLMQAIAPALAAFATAISGVFTLLENSGVFATLGDALENLVAPIGKLITAILTGLTPLLPPLIKFFTQISGLLIGAFTQALGAIIPPLTDLATTVLKALADLLPVILPLLTAVFGVFTGAVAGIITVIAGLDAIIKAIPPSVLAVIAGAILAIVAAMKAWAIIQAVIDALMSANPLGVIVIAVVAIGAAIAELVTHWSTVWATIKQVASDVGSFLDNLFHNSIVQDILAIWSLGLIPLAEHWSTVWDGIKSVISAVASFFTTAWASITSGLKTAWNAIASFFTSWWNTEVTGWKTTLTAVESIFSAAWTSVENTAKTVWGSISSFFTSTWNTFISVLKADFVTPFQNAISGAWNWVKTNVFNPMDTFLTKTVPGWFSTAVSAIGRFWDGVEQIVRVPVAFVVNDVLNPIGQTFDAITSALGLNRPIPKLSMASGGKIPGFGGGDVVPALLEPGETVIDKDKSKAYGWLFKLMGVPGYASGGVIPNPISFISSVLKNTLNTLLPGIVGAGGTVSMTVAKAALDKILGKGVGGAAGEVGTILTTMGTDAVTDAIGWLTGKTAGMGGGGPGGKAPPTSGTVQGWILAAMKDTGAPASWLPLLETLVSRESGGNPNAINPQQVDGENASGLFQTLPSTYAQFATVAGGVFNPIADAVAGIRYIMATYGSPANIPGLTSGNYVGYANGGMITEPVTGWGASGTLYRFGERGSEMVTPVGAGGGGASIGDVVNRLERLISVASQIPASTGQHVGHAIGGSAAAASFRGRYPRGGS